MADTKFNIKYLPFPTTTKAANLTNQIFGRLTVLGYAGKPKQHHTWHCVCICGTKRIVHHSSLIRGLSKSCGCLSVEMAVARTLTHGHSRDNRISPEYAAYSTAKARCNDPNNSRYSTYGKRGIEFLFTSFEGFLKEIGYRPTPDHSLNRIDNDKNYEPGNVEWATRETQSRNRTSNIHITAQNQTHIIIEWSEITGIQATTIRRRYLDLNWCGECSVTIPPKVRNTNGCRHKTR